MRPKNYLFIAEFQTTLRNISQKYTPISKAIRRVYILLPSKDTAKAILNLILKTLRGLNGILLTERNLQKTLKI